LNCEAATPMHDCCAIGVVRIAAATE